MVDLRPTQGVFSAGNVLGSGFTMYETWQISVDLKLRETGADWVQVFQFTSDNAVLYQAGSRVPSVFQPPYPYRKGHRQKKKAKFESRKPQLQFPVTHQQLYRR